MRNADPALMCAASAQSGWPPRSVRPTPGAVLPVRSAGVKQFD